MQVSPPFVGQPGKDAMATQQTSRNGTGALSVPSTLANLLDMLDYRPRGADAVQYRLVASSLARELSMLDRDTLEALLSSSPAAAEIYENLHYAQAGLCRSELDAATTAEMQAKDLIARAAKKPVQ